MLLGSRGILVRRGKRVKVWPADRVLAKRVTRHPSPVKHHARLSVAPAQGFR